MAIVQRSIQIKASPQETMAQLSDASRWPEWYPGMTELTVAAPFPEKEGKVAFKVRSAGMSIPVTESVIDFQPGKLQLFQHGGHVVGARSLGAHPGRRWHTSDHDVRLQVAGRRVRQDR